MINPMQGFFSKRTMGSKDINSNKQAYVFHGKNSQNQIQENKGKKAPIKSFKRFKTLKSIPSKDKLSKPPSFFKKKINSVTDIENISENISIIINYFFDNYPNQERIGNFIAQYENFFTQNYIDVLIIMKEFNDFNIFDFLQISTVYTENMPQKEFEAKKKMITIRNNILLNILIIAKELEISEKEGEIDFEQKEPLFSDLRFLNPFIEKFKNIIIDSENKFNVSYEVEVFFFAILGYKDKSRIIKQKFNQYFKDFLANISITKMNFNDFLNVTLEKTKFSELSDEELIIIRKILNNAAIRNFYFGLEYLMKDTEFCFVLSEGRIWKNIGINMEPYKVYNLWSMYEESIEDIRNTDLRETLSIEYEDRLKVITVKITAFKIQATDKESLLMNEEYLTLLYEKKNVLKEIYLYTVTCLKELIVIFFRNELKGLVLYFFDEYRNTRGETKVPIDIYEICLDYDEDISIDILDRAVNSSNVKKWYMELALLKKYFRLARRLLKFQVCKNCLSAQLPDSDEYLALLSKFQVIQKKKLIEKIKYHDGNEDLKIIDFIQEKNSLNGTLVDGTSIKSSLKKDSDVNVIQKIVNEKINVPIKKRNKFGSEIINNRKIFADDESEETDTPKNLNLPMKLSGIPQVSQFEHHKKEPAIAVSNIIKIDSSMYNNKDKNNYLILNKPNGREEEKDNNSYYYYEENNSSDSSSSDGHSTTNNKLNPAPVEVKNPQANSTKELKAAPVQFRVEITPPQGDMSKSLGNQKINNDENTLIPITDISKRRRRSVFVPNNNNEMDAYTPTSKYSVLSNTPMLSSKSMQRETSSNANLQALEENLNQTKQGEASLQEIKEGKVKINIQMILIEHFRYGQYVFDALCIFSSIPLRNLNPLYFERICSYLLVFTTHDDSITKCSTPLIMIAMAAELLLKISKLNSKIKYKAESVAGEMLRLGENIQSSMKDEDMLNYYLREQTDHNGRSALEVYAENKFYELLGDLSVGVVVGKLWFGTGHEQSIYKFFRLSRILIADIISEHYEPMISKGYLPEKAVYSFQFSQFIKNCSVRNFFESMSVIIITIMYQYVIYEYVTFTKEDITHPKTHYYYTVQVITNILMYLSILNYLFLLLYFYKTGRKLKLNSTEAVINFIMFIAVLCNLIDLPQKLFPVEEDADMNILADGIVYSVLITMGWMKVIIILMTTNSYGPFIRIMFDVFWHVFAFLVIFVCITFLFAQCFTLFFQHTNLQFFEFYEGFVTLFNTAFGQVFFEDNFKELELMGFVMLMLYTTLSNIILFNLIVAIINNLFNSLEDKADAENRAVLVLTHERIKWDNRYGLLILLPAPLNAISLIFIPWLFVVKDSIEDVNLLFSKVCYFIVAVIIFFYLILLGLICYPFALLKSLCHSSYDYWLLNGKNKWRDIALSFLTRPFILLYYFGADLASFWSLVYHEEEIEREEEEDTNLNIRNYIIALRKVLNDARYKEKKKIIPIRELYSKLSLFKKKKKKNNFTSSLALNSKSSSNLISNEVSNQRESNNKKSLDVIYSDSSNEEETATLEKKLNQDSNNGGILNSRNNLLSTGVFFDTEKKQKNIIQEKMKFNFRKMIDKIVDPEGFIDIERTLLILPDRVRYSHNFIKNLQYLNVRVYIRGLTKYFFLNAITNPVFAFKKLQLLMFKLLIKYKMIYSFLPEATLLKINQKFTSIDDNPLYEKTPEALQKYEERDDVSEYDDEGEYVQDISMRTIDKMTINSTSQGMYGTNNNGSSSPTE